MMTLTLNGPVELAVAVECGWDTCEPAVVVVARLDETLTRRDLAPKCLALWSIRVRVDRVRAVASKFRNRRILDVRVRDTISNHHGCQVDLHEVLGLVLILRKLELLVLLVDHRSEVRCVGPAVAFRGDVEGCFSVLGVPHEEEFEKRVDIHARDGTRVHAGPIRGIGEPDIHRLVEEDDVCARVPAVRVVRHVLAIVRNAAWTQLEEKAGRGAAPRATVQPKNERVVLGVISGLKEPTITMNCDLKM